MNFEEEYKNYIKQKILNEINNSGEETLNEWWGFVPKLVKIGAKYIPTMSIKVRQKLHTPGQIVGGSILGKYVPTPGYDDYFYNPYYMEDEDTIIDPSDELGTPLDHAPKSLPDAYGNPGRWA